MRAKIETFERWERWHNYKERQEKKDTMCENDDICFQIRHLKRRLIPKHTYQCEFHRTGDYSKFLEEDYKKLKKLQCRLAQLMQVDESVADKRSDMPQEAVSHEV